MSSAGLEKLLQSAVGAPKYVRTEDGGSIVALTLHCLMVEHGFRVHADRRGEGTSQAAPAAEWNGKYANEWVFDFRRPGYASVFTLHCSLQPASGKMFVHAREVDAPSNMKYMGLLVDRYVPDQARCKQSTWAGVLAEQEDLRDQFLEYIIEPLLEAALPSPEADDEAAAHSQMASRPLSAAHVMWGISAFALTVAVVCMLLKKKSTPPAQ